MKITEVITKQRKAPLSLVEGGNVFAGKTARIALENIRPTLMRYFAELKQIFPRKAAIFDVAHFNLSPQQMSALKHFVPLGSVGKSPDSGDIDLGIDAQYILDQEMSDAAIAEWGINPADVEKEAAALAKRARTSTPAQLRIKAFLKCLTLYINAHAPNLYCDEKKVTAGNIFGLFPQYTPDGQEVGIGVQIDWMIGNLKWLVFSYHSTPYPPETKVKGLHRTQLLLSAFQVANLSFDHVHGVKDKDTGEVIAHDPDQSLAILTQKLGLKTPLTQDNVADYFQLHSILKTLPPEKYALLISIYLKILDSTRCDIPTDLQDFWKANQARLGLKGKFLPDTSALKPYAIAESRIFESGVTGADRIASRADFSQFISSYKQIMAKFPGFVGMNPSGSFNSNPNKQDFGDIDLIVHIKSPHDKVTVKKELVKFFDALPDSIIVPFSSPKYTGKRSYNSGEIVTVRYHDPALGYSVQVDNIIALDQVEAQFKGSFLDMPAEVQGLVLGLVKVATLETPIPVLFKKLGINAPTQLPPNQEYEFNLSSVELQLRKVTYEPGTFKQVSREVIWRSTNYAAIQAILPQYDFTKGFDDLLAQAQRNLKNPRSARRMVGVFGSMISVKSGEVGTPKGAEKERAIAKVNQVFGGA